MKIVDDRTAELTDAEIVVKDWHDSLLDRGLGLASAVAYIRDSVPTEGFTARLVEYMSPYLVEGPQAMDPSAKIPTP